MCNLTISESQFVPSRVQIFKPYAEFLTALGDSFCHFDRLGPTRPGKDPLGYNPALRLVSTIEHTNNMREFPTKLVEELKKLPDYDNVRQKMAAGIRGVH